MEQWFAVISIASDTEMKSLQSIFCLLNEQRWRIETVTRVRDGVLFLTLSRPKKIYAGLQAPAGTTMPPQPVEETKDAFMRPNIMENLCPHSFERAVLK